MYREREDDDESCIRRMAEKPININALFEIINNSTNFRKKTNNDRKSLELDKFGLKILLDEFEDDPNIQNNEKNKFKDKLTEITNKLFKVNETELKFDKLFPWVKYEKFYKYAWTLGDIKNTYGWKDWEKEASVNSKIQSVTKGIDIFARHEGINRKLRECLVLGSIESIDQ